jgi:trehalose 6-phosphate phosphatase
MKKNRTQTPPTPEVKWAYFLDVDGTLIHIADTPQAIQVDPALLALIEQLHHASGGAMALVSGRAISDLQLHLGLYQLPMAGLHGLERRDSAGRLWIHAAPPTAKSAIQAELAPILAKHPGLLLEDKGLTLALHYRQAPALASYVHQLMRRIVSASEENLELQCGKRVVELKPAGIDKGTAVTDYLTESPFKGRRPVFIGDDLNDEHGFAAVNQAGGISIKVGEGPSCARFRLPDVAAVHHWLGQALKDPS